MWVGVEPRELCGQHLLGEHNEIHKLVGGIRHHEHGHAIADGQGEKGNIDTTLINERHDALAEELERRGMDHDSPLDWNPFEYIAGVGAIDEEANREELAERCDDCAHKIKLDESVVKA
jgi:hypothetical protein